VVDMTRVLSQPRIIGVESSPLQGGAKEITTDNPDPLGLILAQSPGPAAQLLLVYFRYAPVAWRYRFSCS